MTWIPKAIRVIVAALWALLGPILVGIFLAIVLGPYRYDEFDDLDSLARMVVANIVVCVGWFYVQVPLAIVFGVVRALNPVSGNRRGIRLGAFVWAFLGMPFFIAGVLAGHQAYFGSQVLERQPPPTAFEFLYPLFRFIGHVVGGAIAGFHVDHYLLRCRRADSFTVVNDRPNP